jgi:hypothetical protein
VAPEVVPTKFERLELERVAPIAKTTRTRSKRVQFFQAGIIDDMPSLEEVALTAVYAHISYLGAMKSVEKPIWEASVQSAYLCLTSNSTWESVPYSKDMKVIASMWKFKLRRDSKGNISKYKARLVARCD